MTTAHLPHPTVRGKGVPLSEADEQSRVAGSSSPASPILRSILKTAHGPLLVTGEQVEERIETPLGVVLRISRRAEPTRAEPTLWIA